MQDTQEMQLGSLGWEEPLEEEATTHSSVLARKMTWTGAWGAAVLGAARSRALNTAHSLGGKNTEAEASRPAES